MSTRQKFILIALAFFVGKGFAGAKPPNEMKRPNVIFVLADDQGYGDFGCYGNKYLRTPNMDRLHEESVRLTHFYMAPVCSPSRASLMTGRYNYRASIWDTWRGGCSMNTEEFTLAEAMQQAGYQTALFGKWHLGYNYPMRPQDQGFEEVLLWDLFGKEKENRRDPIMIHNGTFVQTEGFEDDVVFDHAIDYLKTRKGTDEPFFMYVASVLPHTWMDYQVPEEYVKRFEQYPEISRFNAEILAMVEKLDENLGRLLSAVDELGLAEDTVFIFSSDNGPEFDPNQSRENCGMRGHKGTTYEGGIRLPMFIRWPGVLPAGKDIAQVGSAIDFMPTVLDMCGIKMDLPNPIDGISLWSHINGTKTELVPRTFCGQFYRSDVATPWKNCYIRDGDFKLVNGSELFNLAEDPSEQNDLSEQLPAKVQELRDKYAAWFADVTSQSAPGGTFRVLPIDLGNPAQPRLNLRYSNKHPVHGWPMNVERPGPYRITVNHMQNDLFDETSSLWIELGGRRVSKPVLPNDGQLVFENVTVEPGECEMQVGIDGTFVKRKYRSNYDIGHRNIHVKLMEGSTEREEQQ